MRVFYFFIALSFALSSCDKQVCVAPEAHYISEGILISNEGNFQWGNASVSYYDTQNKELIESVFQKVNNRPLGDVLQSITVDGDYAYLVLNNSARIEVVAINNFESIGIITGFISPRYIHIVNNEKAYVTDLYANKIAVIDLENLEITSFIDCVGWTEEMVQIDDKVYLLNKADNSLYSIDVATDIIHSFYSLDFDVNSFKIDNQNRLWLAGAKNDIGIVNCVNLETGEIFYTYHFEDENPTELVVSDTGSDVYFLSNGVWHINEFTDEVISTPLIPSMDRLFYGLSVNEDRIYIADAINYVQQGQVWVYNTQAELVDEWEVGIIPSEFDFIKQ